MESKEDYKEDRGDKKSSRGSDKSHRNDDARCFELVRDFCMGSGLDKDFEDFANQHYATFDGLLMGAAGGENDHEYHRIYQLYLEVFERKITDFIDSCDGTVEGFHSSCQRILETMDDDSTDRFFVQAILSATDYEVFISLMRGEVQRIRFESQRK